MPTSFPALGKSLASERYHSRLPCRSVQAISLELKNATICFPSLAGVGAALALVGWQ